MRGIQRRRVIKGTIHVVIVVGGGSVVGEVPACASPGPCTCVLSSPCPCASLGPCDCVFSSPCSCASL